MRTRIALAMAAPVAFIGSTVTFIVNRSPAPTRAQRSAASRPARRGTLALAQGGMHGRAVPSTADLRSTEHSGREPIGTFAPIVVAGPRHVAHQNATSQAQAPAPATAPASAGTFVATSTDAVQTPDAVPAVVTVTPVAAPPPPTDSTSTDTADWQCIRVQESGDVYNDPSRPSGAYGILHGTWLALGYSGWPYQAPAALQDEAALTLYHRYGWQPWSSRFSCGL